MLSALIFVIILYLHHGCVKEIGFILVNMDISLNSHSSTYILFWKVSFVELPANRMSIINVEISTIEGRLQLIWF